MTTSGPKPTLRSVATDPVCLLAFGFGSGCARKAPGTFGTLVAVALYLPAWYFFVEAFGNHGLWASLMLFLVLRGLTLLVRLPRLEHDCFGRPG